MRIVYFVLFSFGLASCKNKSLVGHWKVDHLSYVHAGSEDPVHINNKDSLFKILKKGWGDYYNNSQLDSIIYAIQNSFLTINSDQTFKLVDAGSVARDPEGFFAQGKAKGKWVYSSGDNLLTLYFDSTVSRRYKMLALEDSTMLISELFENTSSPITKVRLVRQ